MTESGTISWYFAYGANMTQEVLLRRGLEPVVSEAAVLKDHRLSFEEPGIPWLEPAFASVKPAEGESVHGVLHKFSAAQMEVLDQLESHGYERCCIQVVGVQAGAVEAWFYKPRMLRAGYKPSRRYVRLLIQGAREHDLPDAWIERLEAQPTFHLPVVHLVLPAFIAWLERTQQKSRRFYKFLRRLTGRVK